MMETRIIWLLVVMLVGVTSAAWIPHTDHLNRVIRQNVADDSEKAGDNEVGLRQEMTSNTTDVSVEEATTSMPIIEEVTLTPGDTIDEELRNLDDAKPEVQVSDMEENTTTSSAETTTQSADVESTTEITPQVKDDSQTEKEQLKTQKQEDENVTEKQEVNETFRKVQLKKVSAEAEDIDAIKSFHQPSLTSSVSSPPIASTSRPLKLPTKLLDFLKNQLQTRKAKTTTTTSTISTSTESLPTATKDKSSSSPTQKVFGARIVSRTPAGDELTPQNSPRISRARFFASASSLLSGFVPTVPEREGRAKYENPIPCKSASVDELTTSTHVTHSSETSSTSVVRPPPRRRPKAPAPLPPVIIVKPETPPPPKRTALSRLSKRLRVKPQSSTKSDNESSTPAPMNNIKNVENTTKNNFFRKFQFGDIKSKLTHTKAP